jgi:NAD(P)-dependent dehydrogenase (short-subunit alcohol dehydrogenase family)
MCPYSKTADGFENQIGTNHLGHFALTGLLMPLLLNTKNSRVAVTSSVAHKTGKLNFDDINWEARKYDKVQAYSDSKLANLYFTYELVRKFNGNENAPTFTSLHPGWTMTDLARDSNLFKFFGKFIAQKLEMGTLPTLRSATDLHAKSGDYFGPKSIFEVRGYPVIVQSSAMSHDAVNAKKLWDLSEQLTGVKY